MSNDVYGFIEFSATKEVENQLSNYIHSCLINVRPIPFSQLYNYPKEFIPGDNSFIFDIADGTNTLNATYLIDYNEYDPEFSDIGFPSGAKERLKILLDTLTDIIRITNSKRMVVAMTECNQIETVKKIKLSDFYDIVYEDFEKYQSPPDTLYDITVE